MFYWLYQNFEFLNIFKYISVRSIGALVTGLFIFFFFGEKFIELLRHYNSAGQPIRNDGPQTHLSKKGTPTMGGILILISIVVSTLLWADLQNAYVWITLMVLVSFGILGFYDDYLKIKKKNHKGVPGKQKLIWQFTFSVLATWLISLQPQTVEPLTLAFPFFKRLLLDLGLFYFVFSAVVITGASNAVNLTDGLDGLAIGPIMIASVCFAIFSYIVGNAVFASYLQIHAVPNAGELVIICAAIVGAGLGFLWFNCAPAQVFMGDVGSLALGGALGVISVITKHEIVLAIVGGLFVIEAISVIIQVGYYKMTKKRVFLMAPIHHHYEKKGWSETKVVMRFWIVAIIFALIGLSTLKVR